MSIRSKSNQYVGKLTSDQRSAFWVSLGQKLGVFGPVFKVFRVSFQAALPNGHSFPGVEIERQEYRHDERMIDYSDFVAALTDLLALEIYADTYRGVEVEANQRRMIHKDDHGVVLELNRQQRLDTLLIVWAKVARLYVEMRANGFTEEECRKAYGTAKGQAYTEINERRRGFYFGTNRKGGAKQSAKVRQRCHRLVKAQAGKRRLSARLDRQLEKI